MLRFYSKDYCTYCDKLKALLDSLGVQYEIIDVGSDRESMDFLKRAGHRTLPQVYKRAADGVYDYLGDYTIIRNNPEILSQ